MVVETAKLKIVGPKPKLEEIIAKLELHFVVVRTSRYIEHAEDSNHHIYLMILEGRDQ